MVNSPFHRSGFFIPKKSLNVISSLILCFNEGWALVCSLQDFTKHSIAINSTFFLFLFFFCIFKGFVLLMFTTYSIP